MKNECVVIAAVVSAIKNCVVTDCSWDTKRSVVMYLIDL